MWGRHILAGSHWRLLPQGCSNHPPPHSSPGPASRPSLPGPHWPAPTPQEPKVLLYITPGDVSIFIVVLKSTWFTQNHLLQPPPLPHPETVFRPLWFLGQRNWLMDCVGCGEDSNKQLLGGNTPFFFNHLKRFMKQLLRMFVICQPCCRCHVTNDLLWWGWHCLLFIYQLLA